MWGKRLLLVESTVTWALRKKRELLLALSNTGGKRRDSSWSLLRKRHHERSGRRYGCPCPGLDNRLKKKNERKNKARGDGERRTERGEATELWSVLHVQSSCGGESPKGKSKERSVKRLTKRTEPSSLANRGFPEALK